MVARSEVALMVAQRGISAGMIDPAILPAIVLAVISSGLGHIAEDKPGEVSPGDVSHTEPLLGAPYNLLKSAFMGSVFSATSVSITVETLNEMGKLKTRWAP